MILHRLLCIIVQFGGFILLAAIYAIASGGSVGTMSGFVSDMFNRLLLFGFTPLSLFKVGFTTLVSGLLNYFGT